MVGRRRDVDAIIARTRQLLVDERGGEDMPLQAREVVDAPIRRYTPPARQIRLNRRACPTNLPTKSLSLDLAPQPGSSIIGIVIGLMDALGATSATTAQ